MAQKSLSSKITEFAKAQGFDLVGFTSVKPSAPAYAHYTAWLDKNFEADMFYMSREDAVQKRSSAANLLPNAKTVITLAINYYHDQPPLPKGHGRIARYAYGRDYHKTLLPRLKKIEKFIQENFTTNQVDPAAPTGPATATSALAKTPTTKSYVDTGPILERAFAEQAGLGFIGRNSCLITHEFGSWVLLAEIITDIELMPTHTPHLKKSQTHQCGTCTRCIDACPTGAITLDSKTGRTHVNAKKCLAYLTIEHKGPIPTALKPAIKKTRRVFGCDICQEACPHNCRAKPTQHKFLTDPKIAGDSLPTDTVLTETFAGSPLMRAKSEGLKRNLQCLRYI